jgi:mannose-1-phosphate guanylyltransferase
MFDYCVIMAGGAGTRLWPALSFDYAVAERCGESILVQARFDWKDVGTWDAYAACAGGNRGQVYQTDSRNCFVDADMPVAFCRVDDLIVAVRGGGEGEGPPVVLVAKRGSTQQVRDIIAAIRADGRTDLL